jgi:hypothetical protein
MSHECMTASWTIYADLSVIWINCRSKDKKVAIVTIEVAINELFSKYMKKFQNFYIGLKQEIAWYVGIERQTDSIRRS